MISGMMVLMWVMMLLGTIISLSSSSWSGFWLGLEFNTMGFLPYLCYSSSSLAQVNCMKYYIVQAVSSSFLLAWVSYLPYGPVLSVWGMMLALSLKAGVAPFHYWMAPLAMNMEWGPLISLLTWQKVAPLMMVAYSGVSINLYLAYFSAILGPVMLVGSSSLKGLSFYSSVSNSGWSLGASMYSFYISWGVFIVYLLLSFSTSLLLNSWGVPSLSYLVGMPTLVKGLLALNFLSLSGFPPLSLFLMKINVLSLLLTYGHSLLGATLLVGSVLGMFSYFRVLYTPLISPKQSLVSLSAYSWWGLVGLSPLFTLSLTPLL